MEIFEELKTIDDELCSICLNNINEGNILIQCKQCKKGFHQKCINTWKNYKIECPNCRFKIPSKDDFDEDYFFYNEFDVDNLIFHVNLSYQINTIGQIIDYVIKFFILLFSVIIFYLIL